TIPSWKHARAGEAEFEKTFVSGRNFRIFRRHANGHIEGMFAGSIGNPVLLGVFVGFVLVMLALDLGVFHRKAHVVGLREAAIWSCVWVALAGAFAALVWFRAGDQAALEFTAGYLLEKALAVDNIFVFVVIFSALRVPAELQQRVLLWGIIGAL